MSRHCHYCSLPGGRRLAYAEWGDAGGVPVLYCHGFPGSRFEARLADTAAKELGIRLIAPDRPGFGESSLYPGRRLSDWPTDAAVLMTSLDIPHFHVVGVSGGGPYAMACAERLHDRIGRLSIICGLGELNGVEIDGMNPVAATGIRFYQRQPRFAHGVYARFVGPFMGRFPELIFKVLIGIGNPADRAALAEPAVHRSIAQSFAEAFRQGGEGPAQELGLFTQPWDIDPGRVRVPVSLWHGEDDRTVPVIMGRRHAALLPDCRATFMPGEGHFSLIIRNMSTMLADLAQPPE